MTVDDLLDRVRAEIARRRRAPSPAPAAPGVILAPDFNHLEVLLGHAKRVAAIGTTVPPFGLFDPVRRALARAVTRVLYVFLKVISVDQGVFNGLVLQVLHGLTTGLRQGETALAARFDHLAGLLADGQARLARLDADAAARAVRLETHLTQTTAHAVRLETHLTQTTARAVRLETDLAQQGRDADADLARLRADLDAAWRRLKVLEVAARPDAAGAGGPSVLATPPDLATLYAAFEDRFRGDRAAIAERVREHLPVVQTAGAGTVERPVLDLGCGRGEWLEVLREANLHARGVDTNPVLIEQCRARGLDVALDDALSHLRGMPAASCGAVTAVHLLEHLPFASLIAVLDETVRVLAPGGVAIFETPNAYHLLVGACTFHTDPTHQHALAPDVLRFLAEARGLTRVEIRPLQRSAALPPLAEDAPEALRRLLPYLDAAEDFAVIGYRT